MIIYSNTAQESLLKKDLLHFQTSCEGKSAEQMIQEAKTLFDSLLSEQPNIARRTNIGETRAHTWKIPMKHVKALEEANSLLTKSLFILFESTLPDGFFTQPRDMDSGDAKKLVGKGFDPKEFTKNNGVKSMKDEGKFALKLRFAPDSPELKQRMTGIKATKGVKKESSSQVPQDSPLFTRQTYEKLSIEALALRSRVLLALGRPFQALFDAKNALFFCHRLRVELGEIDTHCDYNTVFSVVQSNEKDLIALYCAQRIRINGMLQVLRTISEAYYAMKSYQNSINFSLLHKYYHEKSISLGKEINETEIDIRHLRTKLIELLQKAKSESDPKRCSSDSNRVNELFDIFFYELCVPREELHAMASSPASIRTAVSDVPFIEEELHSPGGIFEQIMKSSGAKNCRIATVPGMGLGIVATKDIEPGMKVCHDDLLASANYGHRLLCDRCLRPLPYALNFVKENKRRNKIKNKKKAAALRKESRLHTTPCMHEFYCGEMCAIAAESQYHKPLCHLWPGIKAMFEWSEQGVSGYSRMHCSLIRLWAMKRSAPENHRFVQLLCRDSIPKLINVMDGTVWADDDSVPLGQFYETYRNYLKMIPTLARDPMFNAHFFLAHTNMLLLYTFGSDGGSILNLGASFFNHSCAPNVKRNDKEKCFVAKKKVKSGEQLFVSYVDIDLDRDQRALALSQYGFQCSCVRCVREHKIDKRHSEQKI